ncbi:MAG: hypothetical protein ACYTGN_11665 [Planctomycetota bacterium]|jgi:hypothetical protein
MRNGLIFWVGLGLLMAFAPEGFDTGGIVGSILVTLGIALLVTPPAVYWGIMRSLPEKLDIKQGSLGDVHPSVDRVAEDLALMGFKRALTPLIFELPHRTVLVSLVHPDGICATVYRIEAGQGKLAYDVVSMLGSGQGSLTTGMDHGAGVLPATRGVLRQIFPYTDAGDLVLHHRAALEDLARSGVETVGIAPTAVAGLIRQSFRLNREEMKRAPVLNTFIALWRTITKRNPHMGRLQDQANYAEQIAPLRSLSRANAPRPRRTADV